MKHPLTRISIHFLPVKTKTNYLKTFFIKKRFILIAVVVSQVFITASAQKNNQADTTRKQYTQLVNIETNSGENIRAALDRVTADSVFIVPLENDFVKVGRTRFKIIKDETETGIANDQIKSYKINNDPYIVYSDCFEKRKREIKKHRFWKTVGAIGKTTGKVFLAVGTVVGSIGVSF